MYVKKKLKENIKIIENNENNNNKKIGFPAYGKKFNCDNLTYQGCGNKTMLRYD